MRKQTKEMIKVMDETMNYCMKNAFLASGDPLEIISNLTPEEIKAIGMCKQLYVMSKNYLLEAADQMDRIEQKLDLLLKSNEDKKATP